jgi:hypothetical protein
MLKSFLIGNKLKNKICWNVFIFMSFENVFIRRTNESFRPANSVKAFILQVKLKVLFDIIKENFHSVSSVKAFILQV